MIWIASNGSQEGIEDLHRCRQSIATDFDNQLGSAATPVRDVGCKARGRNEVDSWIDELNPNRRHDPLSMSAGGINPNVLMASLVQQQLPKVEIPTFDGSPLQWVEFIVKFRDVVHNQEYLSDVQRHQLLL